MKSLFSKRCAALTNNSGDVIDGLGLVYYILSDEIESEDGAGKIPSFGIEIDTYRGNAAEIAETKSVGDITASEDEIVIFAGMLSDGIVTPMTLLDVAQDYVADRTSH